MPAIEEELTIEEFLAAEQAKDLLRFTTAGSVDDGKSTLIGRLLYDSRNVYEDQVRAVTQTQGSIDFALLTDGLRAEREQGITIDVAYRYFTTPRRRFIIADTPGHEQYTRNMATGASTADLAIVLIDARKGILTQSRRHAFIASLLGIPHVIAAVNKMDLVDYSQEVFLALQQQLAELARELAIPDLLAIPISALEGDNVVSPSERMPWYDGPTLLEHLETVPTKEFTLDAAFRMPVQRVLRPHQDFRGFAGQIASGVIRPGDEIRVQPSGRTARIKSIVTFDGELELAHAPQSVTLTLDRELDISRGDLITAAQQTAEPASLFQASLVWMQNEPLDPARTYLLKHTTRTVKAQVRLRHRIDINTLDERTDGALEMNGIASVEIETSQPLLADAYRDNRITGSFILIDPETNSTAAAGMIRSISAQAEPLKSREAVAVVTASAAQMRGLEEALAARGHIIVTTRVTDRSVWRSLLQIGVTVLVLADRTTGPMLAHLDGATGIAVEPLLPEADLLLAVLSYSSKERA
ncbi:MAG: sulfate adenylyltransferase subunit CysN [Acidobacteria bacterium]|nr:sulfate adenylyltransferase subunit CysN [Acidobacteriota bacterium]MBW4044818.1 sulfate adenylyltransferase subunit CysN [Acidobacteriota bacterium]